MGTYKYEDIIKELLDDGERHLTIKENQLSCRCPFHQESKPSFGINLETGLYNCFSCSEKGNIVKFVSKIKDISTLQALDELEMAGYDIDRKASGYYTLKDYSKEKNLDINYLTKILKMETAPQGNSIRIPYFNQDGSQIAVRYRNHPESKTRFYWSKGSKAHLYGLQFIDNFSSDYVVLVEGESDCHSAWMHDIQAIGVAGAKNFKKEYAKLFDGFDKIYIHQEPDNGGTEFVKSICRVLPSEKLYTISALAVDDECKDLADLNVKDKLNKESLLATAEKIPEIYINEVRNLGEDADHVILANKVFNELDIKFYKGNYYVYEDGVYKEGLDKIEKCMLKIDNNIKKSMRMEVLDYIRIKEGVEIVEIDKNLINFKNGIYHLDEDILEAHSPDIFTLCQLNADYLTDEEYQELIDKGENIAVDKFLSDICCNHQDRIDTLTEFTGQALTYDVGDGKCLFLLGETAGNGKSTFNELNVALFTNSNCCSIAIEELGERFCGSELTNKLLNVIHEVKNIKLNDIAKFKSVVTGNEISVEEKYKPRYIIKPFAHHIFAMNILPEVKNADEGYFRRLQIVPFEAKFTDEEKDNFNFEQLVTPVSLTYYANLCLRAHLKRKKEHRRHFANNEESDRYLDCYKHEDNSVQIFLSNVMFYYNLLPSSGKVTLKDLYETYQSWCWKNHFEAYSRRDFKNIALSSGKFKRTGLKDGYDAIQYVGEIPHITY